MNMLSFESLWTGVSLATNVTIFADMVVALLLGLLFGYERSYHGRAAGMRTYGLVCMVSAAVGGINGTAIELY
ncbi:MAG: MgtC/SapB family protein [Alphaproteobacteria bacterium]|nr:MgtC/SapB family protein [Alphaproteobacteria bacterium]